MEAGSDEPQEYRRTDSLPPVHLLRIEVLRDYFGIPLRTQKNDYGHKWLVIDNLTAGGQDPYLMAEEADQRERTQREHR